MHKTYERKVVALHNIHFEVEQGECLGIVGESGSGKSTLAKVLLRIENIDQGSIQFLGEA